MVPYVADRWIGGAWLHVGVDVSVEGDRQTVASLLQLVLARLECYICCVGLGFGMTLLAASSSEK